MKAQEAALKEVANSKLCCVLAYNKSFNCTDAQLGGSLVFNRDGATRRRGPAKILDPLSTREDPRRLILLAPS